MRLIQATFVLLVWTAAVDAPAAMTQARNPGDADAAIFAAVVAELTRSAQGVFMVDPRVLQAAADLTSVDSGEVGAVSDGRERVLRTMGIPTTAFLADQRCLFAHGLPPAPGFGSETEEQRIARQECRARVPFTSAIIGHARPEGDRVTVAAVLITTSSYAAREYALRPCGRGAWRVVGMRELIGPIQS